MVKGFFPGTKYSAMFTKDGGRGLKFTKLSSTLSKQANEEEQLQTTDIHFYK